MTQSDLPPPSHTNGTGEMDDKASESEGKTKPSGSVPDPKPWSMIRMGIGYSVDLAAFATPLGREAAQRMADELRLSSLIDRLEREARKSPEQQAREARLRAADHAAYGYTSSDAEAVEPTDAETKVIDQLPHLKCPIDQSSSYFGHAVGPHALLCGCYANYRWKMLTCGEGHYWWPSAPDVYTMEQVIARGWATADGALKPAKDVFLHGPNAARPNA